jgi:hypothetical protein
MSDPLEFRSRITSGNLLFSSDGRKIFTEEYHRDPFTILKFIFGFCLGLIFTGSVVFVTYTFLDAIGFDLLERILIYFWDAPWLKQLTMLIKTLWIALFMSSFFVVFLVIGLLLVFGSVKVILNCLGLWIEPVQLEATESWLVIHHPKKIEHHLWHQITGFQVIHEPSGSILIRFSNNQALYITGVSHHSSLKVIVAKKTQLDYLKAIRFDSGYH